MKDANGSEVPGISVRDHCLNVGCMAEALREALPQCVLDLLPPGAVTLIALHDVGKLSPGFLRKCAEWRERYETGVLLAEWGQREKNHAAVSHALIGDWLGKDLAGYAIAAGGHHGFFVHNGHQPSIGQGGRWLPQELADHMFARHREELRRMLTQVFGHDLPTLPLKKKDETLIVFLTGFMTFADWLGSNETFFRLNSATYGVPLPLGEAARHGRAQAKEVMNWLRWGRTDVKASLAFDQLFPFGPKPMQQALMDLAASPGLFIVEAPMGGGKTEAALAAAYQRWTAPDGQRGLYFALPTQLTSERIFTRLETFLSKALATADLATLVHGSAWLREKRVIEIHPASPEPPGATDSEQPLEYAREARLWFASSRQALLAPFGAGTIDQALLGVLPAKHCGLRLFGLSGKVVVLDEVHSYDNYTGTLVNKLVADLTQLNATVIVLSATLTAHRKRDLLLSAGVEKDALPDMTPDDRYPMITSAIREAEGRMRAAVENVPGEEIPKTIMLDHRTQNEASPWEEACEAALAGACVLVIRNTVALAQETWRTLKCSANDGGPPVALLHSRFPRWRRDQLEATWIRRLGRAVLERWKRRFGKGQTFPTRRGCLLVATQVVEQSVDIDADLLITDLAPTDLLFQRLGRLHRHTPNRPDAFKKPKAILLHPTLKSCMEEKELKAAFAPSGFVYPPYVLWRSSRQWLDQTSVTIPRDIRRWLESTYERTDHDDASAVAALFHEWNEKAEKLGSIAGKRTSRLVAPNLSDDEGTFTRWNEQRTANVLLLRQKPAQAQGTGWQITMLDHQTVTIPPFEWSFPAAKAMHANVVRVPFYAVKPWFAENPSWLHDYLDDAVVGVVNGNQILSVSEEPMPYLLRWQVDEGVRIEKNQQPQRQEFPTDEPEDSWW
jgi:CRISPR-associated endonuclease/helicase Cas3